MPGDQVLGAPPPLDRTAPPAAPGTLPDSSVPSRPRTGIGNARARAGTMVVLALLIAALVRSARR